MIEPIRRIAGAQVNVIDPAPAIARHLDSVLKAQGLLAQQPREVRHRFYTSASGAAFEAALARLTGVDEKAAEVQWDAGRVRLTDPSPSRGG